MTEGTVSLVIVSVRSDSVVSVVVMIISVSSYVAKVLARFEWRGRLAKMRRVCQKVNYISSLKI